MCLLAQLCPTLRDPKTAAHQASLPMGFSRQEYWSGCHFLFPGSFPGSSVVKTLPVMQEAQGRSLSWEDPLEESMATHSSAPAWRIP